MLHMNSLHTIGCTFQSTEIVNDFCMASDCGVVKRGVAFAVLVRWLCSVFHEHLHKSGLATRGSKKERGQTVLVEGVHFLFNVVDLALEDVQALLQDQASVE